MEAASLGGDGGLASGRWRRSTACRPLVPGAGGMLPHRAGQTHRFSDNLRPVPPLQSQAPHLPHVPSAGPQHAPHLPLLLPSPQPAGLVENPESLTGLATPPSTASGPNKPVLTSHPQLCVWGSSSDSPSLFAPVTQAGPNLSPPGDAGSGRHPAQGLGWHAWVRPHLCAAGGDAPKMSHSPGRSDRCLSWGWGGGGGEPEPSGACLPPTLTHRPASTVPIPSRAGLGTDSLPCTQV